MIGVVKQWHRLPRYMVDVQSMETFQVRMDRVVSSLIWLKMLLFPAGGLDWVVFKGPFQLKVFYESLASSFECPKGYILWSK